MMKTRQKRILNNLLIYVERCIKFLPRWLIKAILNVLFLIAKLFIKKNRNICAQNFQLVFGNNKTKSQYASMANQLIKSVGLSMMDLLYYVDRPNDLLKIVHIHHEDYLKQALTEGRGVIGVTAHMGNFPLMFVSLAQRGYKVNVIIRPMRDANFSAFMYRQCNKWKINMIQTFPKKQFLTSTMTALKNNELLFILLDEVVQKEDGVKVPFLNSEVTRATGPFLFLKRTASPIIPMFIIKDEKDHYQISIEKKFEVYNEGTDTENTLTNTARLADIIGQYVIKHPLQWGGWFNKRWTAEAGAFK